MFIENVPQHDPNEGSTHTKRRKLILSLIAKKPIGSQRTLAEALAGYGIEATQATLSRDLKALRVAKVANSEGMWRYQAAGQPDFGEPRLNPLSHQALLDRVQQLEEAVFGRSAP